METNNKMREALKLCIDEMCNRCRANAALQGDPMPCINGCEAVRKAKAALAEPVKNCEVGTAEEQSQRFDAFCDAHKYVGDDGTNWCSRNCPCYNNINCGVRWAQMPYPEGGAE